MADKDFYKAMQPGPGQNLVCSPEKYMLVGAWGAGMVGLLSGFFSLNRIQTPVSPLPPSASPKAHETMRTIVTGSALGWRVTKRLFVGSMLYPILVCNLNGVNTLKQPGFIACIVAGGMSGAIFGLRGGPVAVVNGCVTFAVFSGCMEVVRRFRDGY